MEKEDSYLSIISNIIFFGLAMLQYVFIALKFFNVINWSWFWTLIPSIILIGIILIILFIIFCIIIITMIIKKKGGVKHD